MGITVLVVKLIVAQTTIMHLSLSQARQYI